jgi:tetratricopeptide (TPR) repeat protein
MRTRFAAIVVLVAATLPGLTGQALPPSPYQPGVTYQTANPNYPTRNPFYFEGRVDWELLGIATPSNAWEYAQQGIHKQDDQEDIPGAIADYQTSLSMNSVANGSCQLIKTAATTNVNPPPCMFTVRLRLANLLRSTDPASAIVLFQEVLSIDPLRLGVNQLIGETYKSIAEAATGAAKTAAFGQAIAAFQTELNLSPVTALSTQLTGDLANNAHVHWTLAEIYDEIGQTTNADSELDLYLKATQWHSDTYPWRIALAKKRLAVP